MNDPQSSGRPNETDNDITNLSGGPDRDTVRRDPDFVDLAENPDLDEEAQNPRSSDERSGAPFPTHGPDPTGDDPHMAGAMDDATGDRIQEGSGELKEIHEHPKLDPSGEDGPSYERNQGPADDTTGGSTDPNNTLSHSDTQTRVQPD